METKMETKKMPKNAKNAEKFFSFFLNVITFKKNINN